MFVLQHRAVGPGIEVTTSPVVAPVSLQTEIGIQFCPWCGVRLAEWYRKSLRELEVSEIPPTGSP